MHTSDLYRFRKVWVESNSLLKGETSWYRIGDREDRAVMACHLVGNGMGGTSTFHRNEDDPEVLFRLAPKRKVMNFTYMLSNGASGPCLAVIRMKASRGMKIIGPDDREQYRIVDPRKQLEQLWEDILGGAATRYAVTRDRELLGRVARMARPEKQNASSPKGLLGRVRKKIFSGTGSDWCVDLSGAADAIADHRPLIAAILLLIEQTIRMDKSI